MADHEVAGPGGRRDQRVCRRQLLATVFSAQNRGRPEGKNQLSLYPSLSLPISLSLSLSVSLFLSLSVSLYLPLCMSLCLSLSLYLSIYLPFYHLSTYLLFFSQWVCMLTGGGASSRRTPILSMTPSLDGRYDSLRNLDSFEKKREDRITKLEIH